MGSVFERGLAFHREGRLDEARGLYRQVLKLEPRHFDALHLLGALTHQLGDAKSALDLLDQALTVRADQASVYSNRGNVLRALGCLDAALVSYATALSLEPNFVNALNNQGLVLNQLGRNEESVASYRRALAIDPRHADAASNCGLACQSLNRHQDALQCFGQVLELRPQDAVTYFNCANSLKVLGHLEAAVLHYEQAIMLDPANANALNNRGVVLNMLGKPIEAADSFAAASAIRSDFSEALYNEGLVRLDFKQFERAIECFEEALVHQPGMNTVPGVLTHTRMHLADWSGLDADNPAFERQIRAGQGAAQPFSELALTDSGELQKMAAHLWIEGLTASLPAMPVLHHYPRRQRVKLAYFSADFHNHATAYLMAELFELHDKTKFELIAFSFGRIKNDEMSLRIRQGFERFIDVQGRTDLQIAQLARELEIDIAVDLKGYTTDSRPAIFAHRVAPVQVSYLGFPATMGADFMDYLIADRALVPQASQCFYTEKIAYLPGSYQVNDRQRKIADTVWTRQQAGLPETGFVFCCFNNNYKIMPATFDGWMRILAQVPGSVLWLYVDNDMAAANLSREAQARGIDAKRLVFAQRMPLAEHLARHRLADLFLDTLPCNAHTTASDALWAGLPVLTCTGEAFASRVAASLLMALDLPELVTPDQAAYEALAVELALQPQRLALIKQRLLAQRETSPLFDTPRYARELEALYLRMHERHHDGLTPDHLYEI
jgi:predicted O-linked N-acetylglucosamine transferase (SPINDLY family)